jgi:hypothetical protein
MNLDNYYNTTEAANVLGKSIRLTNYHLAYLFEDIDYVGDEPPAIKIYENGVYRCYYRKDAVVKAKDKPKYKIRKKKCKQCGRKFIPKDNQSLCKDCCGVDNSFDCEYDFFALKALYTVLTDERWFKMATKIVVIGWVAALIFVLGGCVYGR